MVCWSKNILQRGQVGSKIGNFQGYTITCVLLTQSCSTVCDPWTIACQASLSMEFPRQEYWSGLSFPFPGDPPTSGLEPRSSALQAVSFLSHQGSVAFMIRCSKRSPGHLRLKKLKLLKWPLKHCTCLHYNQVSVDWLYCVRVSRPKFLAW